MAVEIQMYGLEETQKMLVKLPKNTEKEVNKTEGDFMAFVQKSAKLRAPRFSGQLAESIIKQQLKIGTWQLTVESPYGWFQEYGFIGKFLSSDLPVQGGYRIGDWMQAKGMTGFGFKPSGLPHPLSGPLLSLGLLNFQICYKMQSIKLRWRVKNE